MFNKKNDGKEKKWRSGRVEEWRSGGVRDYGIVELWNSGIAELWEWANSLPISSFGKQLEQLFSRAA